MLCHSSPERNPCSCTFAIGTELRRFNPSRLPLGLPREGDPQEVLSPRSRTHVSFVEEKKSGERKLCWRNIFMEEGENKVKGGSKR